MKLNAVEAIIAICAVFLFCSTLHAQLTIDPEDGSVFQKDSQVQISADGGQPDPMESEFCCSDGSDPIPFSKTVYTGDCTTTNGETGDGMAETTTLNTSSVSTSAGDKTVTASYYSTWGCNGDDPSFDGDDPTDSATANYTVAEVTRIEDSDDNTGYVQEDDGTDVLATVKGSGTSSIHAVCNPDIDEVHQALKWTGTTDEDDEDYAEVDRSTSEEHDISVLINSDYATEPAREATLWIIWGQWQMLFSSQDDCNLTLGHGASYGAAGSSTEQGFTLFLNGELDQWTLTPSGVNALPGIDYDVVQTRDTNKWEESGSTWTSESEVGPGAPDGIDDPNSKQIYPTDNDHIYALDNPGLVVAAPNAQSYQSQIYRGSFKVKLTIDVGNGPVDGSDTSDWHSISTISLQRNASTGTYYYIRTGTNEIDTGATTVGNTANPPQ